MFDFEGNKTYVIVKPTISKKQILQNLWFYMQLYQNNVKAVRQPQRSVVHAWRDSGYGGLRLLLRGYEDIRSASSWGVNLDRINLAIVKGGELRDCKTFWFREVKSRGVPKRRVWSIIGMKLHEMSKYAYNHGVEKIYLEDLSVLGKLKLLWIR